MTADQNKLRVESRESGYRAGLERPGSVDPCSTAGIQMEWANDHSCNMSAPFIADSYLSLMVTITVCTSST